VTFPTQFPRNAIRCRVSESLKTHLQRGGSDANANLSTEGTRIEGGEAPPQKDKQAQSFAGLMGTWGKGRMGLGEGYAQGHEDMKGFLGENWGHSFGRCAENYAFDQGMPCQWTG
jgi:hypothetical protein